MNRKVEVIVTGGRDFDNKSLLNYVLNLFDISRLIQGGASGADKLALNYALLNDIPSKTFNADWEAHGKAAGPIRNGQMLKAYPRALVLAFPGGKGTENCIKLAKETKHVVLRIE